MTMWGIGSAVRQVWIHLSMFEMVSLLMIFMIPRAPSAQVAKESGTGGLT
jgi:hypothetical protein